MARWRSVSHTDRQKARVFFEQLTCRSYLQGHHLCQWLPLSPDNQEMGET